MPEQKHLHFTLHTSEREVRKKDSVMGDHSATRPTRAQKFEEFKKAYPRRKGANPWKPAQALFERAIRQGTDPDLIIAALRAGVGYDKEKLSPSTSRRRSNGCAMNAGRMSSLWRP